MLNIGDLCVIPDAGGTLVWKVAALWSLHEGHWFRPVLGDPGIAADLVTPVTGVDGGMVYIDRLRRIDERQSDSVRQAG
jgi:hypothetical protein